MILSALSVIYINDEQTQAATQEALTDAYTVWSIDTSSGGSTGENLIHSLGNALVMVTVICAMTFVIVALYKFRCMLCLIGYMMFASAMLLGFLGGTMFQVAIDVYRIPIDKPSFYLFLWNFAIVGVMAVFYGTGIPTFVSQGYLVATSVILAWQLAHFDNWTAWTLLVMLALYDLCAVLTPCGPLKVSWLVGLEFAVSKLPW
jgi:presenilin 1